MIMLIMAHGTDENRVNEDGWSENSPGASTFGTRQASWVSGRI